MLHTGHLMDDNMKYIIILVLLSLSISCGINNQRNDDYILSERNIGWMHGNCLAIKNNNIYVPVDITVIKLAETNIKEKATIIRKAHSAEGCLALMDDRSKVNISSGYSFYLVESTAPVDLAIAVIGEEEIDASNFDFCSTSEGIKYYMKNSSETTWEGYYYLGYGTEVTCQL